MVNKILHRKLKIEQPEPLFKTNELGCSGKVSSSCSTSGTSRAIVVKNIMRRHECWKGQDCDSNKRNICKCTFIPVCRISDENIYTSVVYP